MNESDINPRGFGPQQGRAQGLEDEAEMDMCDITPQRKRAGGGGAGSQTIWSEWVMKIPRGSPQLSMKSEFFTAPLSLCLTECLFIHMCEPVANGAVRECVCTILHAFVCVYSMCV